MARTIVHYTPYIVNPHHYGHHQVTAAEHSRGISMVTCQVCLNIDAAYSQL